MKHLDITEFLCDECGEAFALQKLLRKHVITIHGSEELRSALFYLVTPVTPTFRSWIKPTENLYADLDPART
jgi:hypothetical protein